MSCFKGLFRLGLEVDFRVDFSSGLGSGVGLDLMSMKVLMRMEAPGCVCVCAGSSSMPAFVQR